MTVTPPRVYARARERAHVHATTGVEMPKPATRNHRKGPRGREWADRSGLEVAS